MKKIIIYLIGIIVAMTATINLANAQSNESDIIITEILYNPPGNDTIEFIEIYNAGSIAYNLNGYKLSGPFNYTFGQVDIQPNTYYVIANDSARMRRVFGLITGHWGTSNSLANADRMIKIVDAGQNLVDSLHYYSDAPWPSIGSSAGGPSIELSDIFSDNADGANWELSTTFGVLLNNGITLYCSPGTGNTVPANSVKISGYVKDISDNPIDNLLISINPTTSTHTNQSGYYEFFVQKSWSGIVRAENPQYVYSPEYHQIIDIQTDIDNLDFETALLPSGWIFHKTVNSHSFCILNNAFPSGNEIPFGSWIGVFYKDASNNEKCCGATQYTTINTYCLNAWGANSQTGDEGYTEGGEIIWKLYDSNSGTITDVNVEYSSGHTVFQNDGLSIINSFNLDINTQTLVIPEGWSGISSYVIPDNLLLESIFSNHLSKIIAITNDNGIFLPNNPNSTLSNWNAESGWLIKCTENIVVPFTGDLTNNMNVSFPVGWTLFPIKTNEPILIADLFSGMLNNIDIVKGYGYNEIYIPGISGDFMLIPGKAYKARMNTATTVTFGFSKGFSGSGIHEYTETLEKSVQEDVAQTSSDHVFVFIDAQNLKVGDVISAFTGNGLLVGSGEVSGNFTAIFKAFGDDFTTSSIDGLAENERVRFKITRDNKTYSTNIQFAPNTINHDYFVNDGISYISKVRINFDGIEEYSSAINVYPNPAKDIVHVRISDNLYVNSSEIKIFDFTGKLIKKLEYQIGQIAEIYVGDLAKGIYNINYVNRNIIFVKE